MKSKLNQKLSTSVIVLLIITLFIPVLALAGTPCEHRQGRELTMMGYHGQSLGIWRNPKIVQELKLTENQLKQIKDIDFTFYMKELVTD